MTAPRPELEPELEPELDSGAEHELERQTPPSATLHEVSLLHEVATVVTIVARCKQDKWIVGQEFHDFTSSISQFVVSEIPPPTCYDDVAVENAVPTPVNEGRLGAGDQKLLVNTLEDLYRHLETLRGYKLLQKKEIREMLYKLLKLFWSIHPFQIQGSPLARLDMSQAGWVRFLR